eukprot:scaffold4100_cov73-Skeletonema_marinoi.AAC.1
MNSCAGSSKGLLKSRKGVDETEASGHIAAGRIVEGLKYEGTTTNYCAAATVHWMATHYAP